MQPEGAAAAPLHGRMVRLAVSDARFRGRLAKAGLLVGGRYVCRVLTGKVRARRSPLPGWRAGPRRRGARRMRAAPPPRTPAPWQRLKKK